MQSSNDNQVTISPNLLKNFDVYGVLLPQKTGANNSVDLKVDKLIDIDDCSQGSGIQDCDLNPSFLDQNRDFDLVDLFQNIFVTPQHIKQKQTVQNIEGTKTEGFDIDLKQFLDKYESSQKVGCIKGEEDKSKRHIKQKHTVQNIEGTKTEGFDIDLKQFLDKYESSQKVGCIKGEEDNSKRDFHVLLDKPRVLVPKVLTEPDSDPEDLVNEILTQKILEKRILNEINRSPDKPESSKNLENTDVVTDFSRLRVKKSVTENSELENRNNESEPHPSDFKMVPTNNQINNAVANFVVQSIQKDEKLYKKNRLVKPERMTATFTKGPDFNEKSIVLPQIMARLNARRDYLDDLSNQKRRLILDTGSQPVKAESTVLNNNGQLKRNSNIQGTRVDSVKPDHLPINKDPKLCMNSITGSIAVHSTAKPCNNCTKSGGKNSNNSTAGASTSVHLDNNFGKVSPTVLMEDCNKERLKALKQSQMIKNFILTGKFDP